MELGEPVEHTKRSSLSHHVSLKSTNKLGEGHSSKQSHMECPRNPVISIAPDSENPNIENVDSCKNMPQSKDFNTLGYDLVAPKRKVSERINLDIVQSPRKRPSFENE